jgi:hypothetical protein
VRGALTGSAGVGTSEVGLGGLAEGRHQVAGQVPGRCPGRGRGRSPLPHRRLHYRLLAEEPTHPTIVTADPQGPLLVCGDLVLDTPEGPLLFRTAARTGRPRLTGVLVGWYLVVALLHTLWDASGPMAVWLTLLLTATQAQWALIQLGRVPQPTQAQTFTMINGGLLLVDALLGVAVLHGRWRQALAWSTPSRPPATPPLLKAAKPPPRPHCGPGLAATR